jgi:chromosome partitioning protein
MSHAFISYSRKDALRRDQILRLFDANGLSRWVDLTGAQAGDRLTPALEQAIDECSCFVLLLTGDANRSRWVRFEVERAVAAGKPILIVAFGGATPSRYFPALLRDLVRVDVPRNFSPRRQQEVVSRAKRLMTPEYLSPVIAMLNMKGGVGKTALSANLFGCIHEMHRKSVLLVDLDPQHNLTQLLIDEITIEANWRVGRSVLSAFERGPINGFPDPSIDFASVSATSPLGSPEQLRFALRPADAGEPRLDLILGNFAVIRYNAVTEVRVLEALRENFRQFIRAAQRDYDLIVLDINPGSSFLTDVALTVTTHIISPVRPDRYSRYGLKLLDDLLLRLYSHLPPKHQFAIMNGVDRGEQSEIETWIRDPATRRDNATRKVLSARIGQSRLMEARVSRPGVSDYTADLAYRPHLNGGAIRKDLVAAADELITELGVS